MVVIRRGQLIRAYPRSRGGTAWGDDAGFALLGLSPLTRGNLCSNGTKGKHEVATRICQSFSQSCNAEGLAWGSSAKKIDICIRPLLELCHVAPIRDAWIVMSEDCARERFDLTECNCLPPQRIPRDACCLDSAAYAEKPHFVTPM